MSPAPARPALTIRHAVAVLLPLALAGCSLLGGGDREPSTIYAPDPRVTLDASAPTVEWQLALVAPQAARIVDSSRIAVRPLPGELQVYRGASWAKPPPDMLQDALLRALEDSGRIPAVARQGAGVFPDYKLLTDVRRFEADYAGKAVPAAVIEVNAKLVHGRDQSIVASRTFERVTPSAGTDIALVADAFSRGMEQLTGELALWILTTGDAHQRSQHPGEPR
ncbi:ABC-type transport auxiliary lipoprotein family protein [Luteimonas composti]|uniref:ABC-type transport auxiliary lipoprotein family protein n=1 Tax=Luteimonas composti TaxID=398257 RepID=UPI00362D038C